MSDLCDNLSIKTEVRHGCNRCFAAPHESCMLHGVQARLSLVIARCAGYVTQHLPGVATKILHRVGPRRVAAMKAGGSGYDVGGLMRGGKDLQ